MTHLFNLWAVSCNICVISAAVISSRFPVGSSASIIGTSVAKERAIATRCCCPPDYFKIVRFSSLSESPRRFKRGTTSTSFFVAKVAFSIGVI